jgi:hypothetical protein
VRFVEESASLTAKHFRHVPGGYISFPALAFYSIACLHALADRKKEAFDSLEQALEMGYRNREHIDEDKDLDRIRRDARFTEMKKKYFGT